MSRRIGRLFTVLVAAAPWLVSQGGCANYRASMVCGGWGEPDEDCMAKQLAGAIDSVIVVPPTGAVHVGERITLMARLRHPKGVVNLPPKVVVIWTSSDSTVASVTEGHVMGNRAGEATITATAYDITPPLSLDAYRDTTNHVLKGVAGRAAVTVLAAK